MMRHDGGNAWNSQDHREGRRALPRNAMECGKSPDEHAREQRTNTLIQLKKDIIRLFKCIKEPYDNIDPESKSQLMELCGEPVSLSSDEMQRLLSLLEKYGVEPQFIQLEKEP
jgi:hypothetical protein